MLRDITYSNDNYVIPRNSVWIHPSELRTKTKVVFFIEKSSFRSSIKTIKCNGINTIGSTVNRRTDRQCPKQKEQKDKQWSTKHYIKRKDRATRTLLKFEANSCASESEVVPAPLVTPLKYVTNVLIFIIKFQIDAGMNILFYRIIL
jgi:hypothetical protein